jgi:hypothetical protein
MEGVENGKRRFELIVPFVGWHCVSDATTISETVSSCLGVSVSTGTIRSRLKEAGFRAHVKMKKPLLTNKQIRAQLKWAKEHINWTDDDWSRVLWTDESKFNLFGSDGRQWCYRRSNCAIQKQHLKPTVKYGGGGVLVWGNLNQIVGIMDAAYYEDILEDNLLESATDLFGLNPIQKFIFQQDSDPKHTAGRIKEWITSKSITVMKWPSQSPDLNPIEHLWNHIDRQLQKKGRGRNLTELWERVKEEWMAIPQSVTEKLVKSMHTRCEEVIRNKDLPTHF